MRGLLVALYLALVAPILGFGVSISLTEGLYIPTFIASVIAENKLYLILVSFLMLVFLSVGIANLFILHGIVIDKMTVKEASLQSGKLIHENWKDYLKHFLCSSADGLITDKVVQAVEIKKKLKERSDFQRIVDRILAIVS